MKKKLFKAASILICVMLGLAACSPVASDKSSESGTEDSSKTATSKAETETSVSEKPSEGGKNTPIELAYNLSTEDFAVFEDIIKGFSEETGIGVNIYNGGDDYEAAMKTRMSSGDLPDMWVTHGWSLIRYSEYMMDLSDQPWVENIDNGLKDVITNKDGELFILPVTQAVLGLVYNKDVLEQAGVDPAQIVTWKDFDAACKAVLDKTDAAPIGMCLGNAYDSYSLEIIWPTLYSNSDLGGNKKEALLDGSFDWKKEGREAYEMMGGWYKAGYLNDDFVSGKKDDVCKAMANGKGAFSLYSADMIPSVLAYNKDAHIGILPAPAKEEGKASYFGTGEGNFSCFGIWKDTKYETECKQLLEYLARPEIAVQIVMIDGGIPGLTNIELDEKEQSAYTANAFKEAQAQFEGNLVYDNFFDREYLPSGMWSVMADSVATLLADGDPDTGIDEAVSMAADNYVDLMGN